MHCTHTEISIGFIQYEFSKVQIPKKNIVMPHEECQLAGTKIENILLIFPVFKMLT